MKQDFDAILDVCWQEIEEGRATIESCVARYPQEAARLEAFLRLAERLRTARQPELSAPAMAAIEARMLRRAEELRRNRQARLQPRAKPAFFPLLTRAAAVALAMVLAAVLLGAGVVFASTHSLPDSPLYSVKRAVEQVQLALTFDQAERSTLHLTFANRRLSEAITLLQTKGELDEETELALEEAERSSEATALWAMILDTTERQQVALQEVQSSLPENDRQRINLALAASRRLQARARQATEEVALQVTGTSQPPTSEPSTPTPPTIVDTATSGPEPTGLPTAVAIVPTPMVTEKPAQPHLEQERPMAGQLALSFGSEYTEVQDVHTASVNLGLLKRADAGEEGHGRSAAKLIQAKKAGIMSWGGIKKLGGRPGGKGKNLGWAMSAGKEKKPPAKSPDKKIPPGKDKDKDKNKDKDSGGGGGKKSK
jgi:hypothetical protein